MSLDSIRVGGFEWTNEFGLTLPPLLSTTKTLTREKRKKKSYYINKPVVLQIYVTLSFKQFQLNYELYYSMLPNLTHLRRD